MGLWDGKKSFKRSSKKMTLPSRIRKYLCDFEDINLQIKHYEGRRYVVDPNVDPEG